MTIFIVQTGLNIIDFKNYYPIVLCKQKMYVPIVLLSKCDFMVLGQ